jgi:PIN domain nuclease of toxin-antitoxin system
VKKPSVTERVVLDAAAILALFNDEPGAALVADHLPAAAISTVNVAEVISKLVDHGMQASEAASIIQSLDITVVPFDIGQAVQASDLRNDTRQAGLSLGDRACLALARHLGVPAMTSDRAWKTVKADVEIILIR